MHENVHELIAENNALCSCVKVYKENHACTKVLKL